MATYQRKAKKIPKKVQREQLSDDSTLALLIGSAEVQSPKNEILAVCGLTIEQADALCNRKLGKSFDDVIGEARLRGLNSLRSKQFRKAEGGDTLMLIWLGKNALGQSDKAESKNEHTVTHKGTIMFGDQEISFDN